MPHLQLKDIPAGTHDALRARAKRDGISMREYVLRLIEADVGKKDTWEETRRKMREGPRVGPGAPSGAELVRQGREERDQQILAAIEPFFDDRR